MELAQRITLDDDVLAELCGRHGIRRLALFGSAQVSPATQHEYPDVPWSAAAKMRDRLVHHYFDIDLVGRI